MVILVMVAMIVFWLASIQANIYNILILHSNHQLQVIYATLATQFRPMGLTVLHFAV